MTDTIEEHYKAVREQTGSEATTVEQLELQSRLDMLRLENERLRQQLSVGKEHVVQLEDAQKKEFIEGRRRDERIAEFERQVIELMREVAEGKNKVRMVKLVHEGAIETIARLEAENRELRMKAEQHERLSQTDELTGLLNRHAFKTVGPAMFEMYRSLARQATPRTKDGEKPRENRWDASFNAIYIDLNGFKEINDNIEHAAGDEALKRVADALRTAVRQTDPIFRMGGDEFLVLFVSREDSEAKVAEVNANRFIVAERIRRALEKTGFTFSGVKVPGPVEVPPLTAMLGVAEYIPREGEGLNEVVQEADAEALKLKDKKKQAKMEWESDPNNAGKSFSYTTEIAYAQPLEQGRVTVS